VPTPRVESFCLGDFMTNCFVVTVPDADDPDRARDCWIVDCGFDPEPMFEHIDRERLTPKALLLTHSHADHIAGVDQALGRYGRMPLYLHEAEQGFCSDPMLNLSAMLAAPVTCVEPDHWLSDGDALELNGTTWRVVHAPGHSPGGVLFVNDESNQAIVGDTLFAGSIGRFDFPTSDPEKLRHSIFEILMNLPDEMRIYPGHLTETTIGRERETNPFVRGGF
jgi:hydroxyacylglutathione hydrolase